MLWITGAFHTSPLWKVKAIVSLIPIHLHLNKISRRHYLRVIFLLQQHTLNSLLNKYHVKKAKPYYLSMGYFTYKQCSKIKSLIIDTNF